MRLNINQIEEFKEFDDFDDFDDLDEIDDFAEERSRDLQRSLDGHRRRKRAGYLYRQRSRSKGRRDYVDWDWSENDDWIADDLTDYEDQDLRY